jgi:hypothetical protein
MERFESFIRDDTERQAQEEEAKFETATRTLTQLAISLPPLIDSIKEVELYDKALARAVRRALASARLRRYTALLRAAEHDDRVIPAAKPFPSAELAVLESETTGEKRKALEAERQELADRAALNAHMPAVSAEIARLQAVPRELHSRHRHERHHNSR